MPADAVIVAAGSSTRFGEGDKLLADLFGRPVLAWSLAAAAAAGEVERVILVAAAGQATRFEALAREFAGPKFDGVVAGGARRRDSVEAGLRATRARYVAIHDGARPLVTPDLFDRCVGAAAGRPGAIPVVPVTDSIKEVRGGTVAGHPDRSLLRAAQTPQVVLRQAWLDAAAAADGDETDDAAMLARLGLECRAVDGEVANIKVTTPTDLELVRLLAGRSDA